MMVLSVTHVTPQDCVLMKTVSSGAGVQPYQRKNVKNAKLDIVLVP